MQLCNHFKVNIEFFRGLSTVLLKVRGLQYKSYNIINDINLAEAKTIDSEDPSYQVVISLGTKLTQSYWQIKLLPTYICWQDMPYICKVYFCHIEMARIVRACRDYKTLNEGLFWSCDEF